MFIGFKNTPPPETYISILNQKWTISFSTSQYNASCIPNRLHIDFQLWLMKLDYNSLITNPKVKLKMNKPFVTLNIAMTADGKIDTFERQGARISSESDWRRVDELRADNDAVLVGGNTLTDEDPRLTVKAKSFTALRIGRGQNFNPIKVGVITEAKFSENSRFIHEGSTQVFVFTTNKTSHKQIANLEEIGVNVDVTEGKRVDLRNMMNILKLNDINKLLVEGGGTINAALLKDKLVDEVIIYIAPILFLGSNSPTMADGFGLISDQSIKLNTLDTQRQGDGGIIIRYHVIN